MTAAQPLRRASTVATVDSAADDTVTAAISQPELERLYTAHWEPLVRTATWLTGDPALAEEVVQDSFIRLVEHWPTLRNTDRVGGWLRTTVLNLCRTRLRRRSLGRRKQAEVAMQRPTEQIELGDHLHDGPLGAAIRELPRRQQECVVLRFVHDLTVPQLADALGISEGTAKTHLHRALRALESTVAHTDISEDAR